MPSPHDKIFRLTFSDPTQVRHLLESGVSKDAAEAIMTVAEKLRQGGRAEGRAELVLEQLALRFGELDAGTEQQVRQASAEQLDRIAERVLNADNLQDALG